MQEIAQKKTTLISLNHLFEITKDFLQSERFVNILKSLLLCCRCVILITFLFNNTGERKKSPFLYLLSTLLTHGATTDA